MKFSEANLYPSRKYQMRVSTKMPEFELLITTIEMLAFDDADAAHSSSRFCTPDQRSIHVIEGNELVGEWRWDPSMGTAVAHGWRHRAGQVGGR